jgi:DNA-binding NarL/FixJ family response regulator
MLNHKKILIADPSSVFRRTLKDVVKASQPGIDFLEAGSTERAVHLLKDDPPDVVFVDIALSTKNGPQLIATMRDMVPDSRIVVLTSHDSVEHEMASMEKGADWFLSKERSGGMRLIDVINTAIGHNGEKA